MFSTFGPDTLKELRTSFADAYAHTQRFTDMHDLGDELVQAGFADPVMDMELVRMTWPSAEAALEELRALGAVPHGAHAPGLRTPHAWQRLVDGLNDTRQSDGRISLTFELVYGHAFRPRTERARDGAATFDLEQLRNTARQPGLSVPLRRR